MGNRVVSAQTSTLVGPKYNRPQALLGGKVVDGMEISAVQRNGLASTDQVSGFAWLKRYLPALYVIHFDACLSIIRCFSTFKGFGRERIMLEPIRTGRYLAQLR